MDAPDFLTPTPNRRVSKLKFVTITILTCLLVLGLWLYSRLQWIPAGFVGVLYNASGGLENKVYKPQRLFVGPFQQLYLYPTKLQAAIYSQDPNFGEVRAADGVQITTSDTATTTFDVAVFYRVEPDSVFQAFKSFGPIRIEDIQIQHIRRAVREAANAVGTQYDVFQLLGPKREEASLALTVRLKEILAKKGITIEQSMLLSAKPAPDIEAKINARVNSYTQLTISRLLAQIAEVSRQTLITRAQAETLARTLQADQTKDKSLELLDLEMQEEAVEAWNGKLPAIQSQPGQTIILSGDAITALGGKK